MPSPHRKQEPFPKQEEHLEQAWEVPMRTQKMTLIQYLSRVLLGGWIQKFLKHLQLEELLTLLFDHLLYLLSPIRLHLTPHDSPRDRKRPSPRTAPGVHPRGVHLGGDRVVGHLMVQLVQRRHEVAEGVDRVGRNGLGVGARRRGLLASPSPECTARWAGAGWPSRPSSGQPSESVGLSRRMIAKKALEKIHALGQDRGCGDVEAQKVSSCVFPGMKFGQFFPNSRNRIHDRDRTKSKTTTAARAKKGMFLQPCSWDSVFMTRHK